MEPDTKEAYDEAIKILKSLALQRCDYKIHFLNCPMCIAKKKLNGLEIQWRRSHVSR